MTATVTLPWWVLILLSALALWAVLELLLLPLIRWFLSARADRVVEEVSKRLRIGIRPFQQTPRRALIGRLLADPKVQQAAERYAAEQRMPVRAALGLVERYANEIVPAFNAYLYFRISYWLARKTAQALYRVRVGSVDSAGLAAIDPSATVVFVMNHRSNMDYILVCYVVAEHAALSYAVGEWAQIWPLSSLVRAMGAYFVRRGANNELYRRVLASYVAMATEAGVPQAVFPEGGLTRDGSLREPRLGVLDYMIRGFRLDGDRDLVFVPIGLNYDRVLEDRTLLLSGDAEAVPPGRTGAAWRTVAFVFRNLRLMLQSKWYRFGYACMNVGSPLSMRTYCGTRRIDFGRLGAEERHAAIAELGRELMASVKRVIPVVPVPMIATVFLQHQENSLSELELKAATERLLEDLERRGARLYIPRKDLDYAITVGVRMLLLRRLVDERDGMYAVRAGELPVLRFYANSIAHLLSNHASPVALGSRPL